MCLTVDGLPSSSVVVGDTCEPVHDVVEGAALIAEIPTHICRWNCSFQQSWAPCWYIA